MRFFSTGMRYLKQQLFGYTVGSSYNILAVGLLGTIGHPVYWLWWTYIYPQPNENVLMRIIGVLMCMALLLHQHWPVSLKRFLPIYYFLTVAYTLPFFFTYYLLSSHYSMIWVIAEIAMVFLSMLVLSSIIAWVLNLALGLVCAILCAKLFIPQGIDVDDHLFLYVYFPVFVFTVLSGIGLSHNNAASFAKQTTSKILQALDGSVSQDMRDLWGQLTLRLDRVDSWFPMRLRKGQQSEALPSQQLKNAYQYIAAGDSTIRSSPVTPMIVDVESKDIDTTNFVYLQAAQTTQQVIDEYDYENVEARHKIRIEVKRDFIFKGDKLLYSAVVSNFIKNALRSFNLKPSATLTITIDQPTITVRDTGPGATHRLPYSFEAGDAKNNSEFELAYSKQVMQAFGGDVTCRSIVGEFTEFVLHFPEVPQSTWVAYEQSIFDHKRLYFKDKRILVVDDDETLRIMTQNILSKLGAYSDEAEHGQMALQQLTQASYDAIVMDLNMPVLDGYGAAEKIRAGAVPGYDQIPIVAYTTDNAYVAQVKTKKAGIHYFANKACGHLALIQVMAQALKESTVMSQRDKLAWHKESVGKVACIAGDNASHQETVIAEKNSAPPVLTAEELFLFDLQRLATCKERGLFKQGENSAYCRQSKEWLAILETSIVQRDFQKMKDALHFLKGSSANIGAQTFSEFVAKIDRQAAENNWPHEEDWFGKIKTLHARTLSALLLYCL